MAGTSVATKYRRDLPVVRNLAIGGVSGTRHKGRGRACREIEASSAGCDKRVLGRAIVAIVNCTLISERFEYTSAVRAHRRLAKHPTA